MQENHYLIRQEELIENPDPRIPVCLVLDTSYSMSGQPIQELQEGVQLFFKAIKEDEIAASSAEIAIVTFGNQASVALDFQGIEHQNPPLFVADGSTPMGAAVNLALDLLEQRKEEYKQAGVDYYQPWMVLMTDGMPTDDISGAAHRVTMLAEKRKLTVFPIMIGPDASAEALKALGGGRPPLRLKGLNFREFFTWLSKSVQKVSQSTPGEKVPLDIDGLKAWAEV